MSIHCYDCDEVKDIIEIAPAHQWEEDLDIGDPIYTVDKEPTCTEPGSESVHCLVCDDTNASTIREIPATGHDYEAVVTKPDCENGGYTTMML